MSWSPYKDTVIAFVERNPGCSKWDVASHCTRSSRRCPSKQYYIVNTAMRNGWIVGRQVGRAYRLYVPGQSPDDAPAIPADASVRFDSEGGFHVAN